MTIAYILDQFPSLTQTFILNEILELEKDKKIKIVIFSDDSSTRDVQPNLHKLRAKIIRIPTLVPVYNIPRCLSLFLKHFIRHPLQISNLFIFICSLFPKKRLELLLTSFWLAEQTQRLKISHLHSHFLYKASDVTLITHLYTQIPFSLTIHTPAERAYRNRTTSEKIKHSKFIVTIGNYNLRLLNQKYSQYRNKFRVVRYGINLDQFNLKSNYSISDRFRILSTGRLVNYKGFPYLIKAAGIMLTKGLSNFEINIIGKGTERSHLTHLINMAGLQKKIKLLGPLVQDSRFRKYLSTADVFVLPCISLRDAYEYDGVPVALLEAMSFGLPVISTNISNIPDAVSKDEGILVEERNPEKLAEAMMGIYNLTENKRRLMGERGRLKIMKYYNQKVEIIKIKKLFSSA